jgi:hypothetical protein
MPTQVVNGAQLLCSMGAAPSTLVVLPLNRVMSSDQLAATVMDHVPMVNIQPFGFCRSLAFPATASATTAAFGTLTPMPCVPGTVSPWTPGSATVLLGNQLTLNNACKLACIWAGVIEVVVPGQATEFVA